MNANKSLEQDQFQRELALDHTQSFIVQAPAGSGKTELLIQRFLNLLQYANSPDEIFAITFTKKAASEMRARVVKALKNAQLSEAPASAHAKKTWDLAKKVLRQNTEKNWGLVLNPNQLRIQTIDSLCAYLTKQLPILSHFGAASNISDDPTLLYREAVEEILSHVEEDCDWAASIECLLGHLDNNVNKLRDLLVSLLSRRDQWLPYLHLDQDDTAIKNQLEYYLNLIIDQTWQTARDVFPAEYLDELISLAKYAAENLSQKTLDEKSLWLMIPDLFLKKDLDPRKKVDKTIGFPSPSACKNKDEKKILSQYIDRMKSLIENISDDHDLKNALIEIKHLPKDQYDETQWNVLKSLLYVLKIVSAQLRLTFQQHGEIDYIENTQGAITALGSDETPTDLTLSLDYRIQHILIDEFQDTSSTQFKLLEKLICGWQQGDGRTLFIVGDPMQSIYRFREAEVGLFLRAKKYGVGNIKLKSLLLSVNFRSTTKIVHWINDHFKHIFPKQDDMASGAIHYSECTTHTHSVNGGSINITGFLDADKVTQADEICKTIQKIRQENPLEKIAILVRARSHLTEIIHALKNNEIPFNAVDIEPLETRQHIQDLCSLTYALMHPADRLSWLAILRAPWCGLNLHDLYIVSGNTPDSIIPEQLLQENIFAQISPDGQKRLLRILPVLQNQITNRARQSLRLSIENTWHQLGGPACLEKISDMGDAHAYFDLLDALDQTGMASHLHLFKEKINRLFANTKNDPSAIQIMTIHSAKGLEFDTVILPSLEKGPSNDESALLLWMEHSLENQQSVLLLAPIKKTGSKRDSIYDYVSRSQQIKLDHEMSRLFYVAATRAKNRLLLFFNAEKDKNGEVSKPAEKTLLSKLWPIIKNQIPSMIQPMDHQITTEKIDAPITRDSLKRLLSDWEHPAFIDEKNMEAASQTYDGFELSDDSPRIFGIIIHRILQHITQQGIAKWKEAGNLSKQFITTQLIQTGVSPDKINTGVVQIHRAIENVLSDPRGQWILSPHALAHSEFAITALWRGKLKSIVIDRTFIDADGIRWIIDYKSAIFSEGDQDVFMTAEKEKYTQQLQEYFHIMKLMDKRPIRLGLYFPAIPAWLEWDPEHSLSAVSLR